MNTQSRLQRISSIIMPCQLKKSKKPVIMIEIKEIPFQICEHNPKAQSVCCPDETVDLNEFFENIQTQIKKIYDTQRSNSVEETI
jgi:hypothetical protein